MKISRRGHAGGAPTRRRAARSRRPGRADSAPGVAVLVGARCRKAGHEMANARRTAGRTRRRRRRRPARRRELALQLGLRVGGRDDHLVLAASAEGHLLRLDDRDHGRASCLAAAFSWPLTERPEVSIEASPGCAFSSSNAATRAPGRRRGAPGRCGGWRDPLRVAREQQALVAGGPAGTRRGRAADLLHEPVVAAAAADAALRAKRRRAELEDGARVVVQAAHERLVELVRHARRLEECLHLEKCSASSPERWSMRSGAPCITACVPGSFASNARSGFSSMRLRTSSESCASLARR